MENPWIICGRTYFAHMMHSLLFFNWCPRTLYLTICINLILLFVDIIDERLNYFEAFNSQVPSTEVKKEHQKRARENFLMCIKHIGCRFFFFCCSTYTLIVERLVEFVRPFCSGYFNGGTLKSNRRFSVFTEQKKRYIGFDKFTIHNERNHFSCSRNKWLPNNNNNKKTRLTKENKNF